MSRSAAAWETNILFGLITFVWFILIAIIRALRFKSQGTAAAAKVQIWYKYSSYYITSCTEQ